MSPSKATSLQSSLNQRNGNIFENTIMLDDDSDGAAGDSQESDTVDHFNDYIDLEDYGRKIKLEGQGRVFISRPLNTGTPEAIGLEKYNSKIQSDPRSQAQKAPTANMYCPKQNFPIKATLPTSETTDGIKSKYTSDRMQRNPPTASSSLGHAPSSFVRPELEFAQRRSESQARFKAIAASARKNHSTLARERAEKALAERAAQCLQNEDENDRSVDKVLQSLASKKTSKGNALRESITTIHQRREEEASTIASHCGSNASPAAKVPDVGSLALTTPPKTPASPLHKTNPHATAPTGSKRGSAAFQTFSDALSSSKSTQERKTSGAPFGTLILKPASTAKVPTMPIGVALNPQDGLNPQTATLVEPKCGFAALSTSSKGPSSSKEQRFRELFDLSPASSAEGQSNSTKDPRAPQYEQIVCLTGSADPKRGSIAPPASKAQIKPKQLNGTKPSTKDLPPPLPVFDPKRKRLLAHIPLGEHFRPDQVVSKQGYHDYKRQRRQEKREAALHAAELAEVQPCADAAWATMGDVYATPVQVSKQQEPSGKLELPGATFAVEGNEDLGDDEALLIIDSDVQTERAGSERKLSVSHLDMTFTRPLSKVRSSQVTKKRFRKRSSHKITKEKENSNAARELEPTHICGVFTPSKVPQGQDPTQLIPKFCLNIVEQCNTVCIICEGKFDRKRTLRGHFPKCVEANGNPESHFWFDHPSVEKQTKQVATWRKRITTERQKPDFAELSGSESGAISTHGSEVSFKTDEEISTKQPVRAPQLTIQEDAEDCFNLDRPEQTLLAPAAHPTIARKSVSDATLAKWAAEEVDDDEDGMSDVELETPDIAYRYYVKRYEWPVDQLDEEHARGNTFGPFYTMIEANILAEQEVHRLDADLLGNHSRNWRHIYDQDEAGMRSYTVEVIGMHIQTVVYRELIPPASLRALPSRAFTAPLRIYAVRTLFWDSIAAETTDYGCYTILNLANKRAGELWLDDAKGTLPAESVKKDEMAMRLRKDLEVMEQEETCFDRDLSDGKGGRKRVWVVGLEVGGPRN